MEITSLILDRFFPNYSRQALRDHCPNQMLWEAIRASDALQIEQAEVLFSMQQAESLTIMREPFPFIFSETEPDFLRIAPGDLDKIVPDWNSTCRTQPLYIFDDVFSWMIVLTAENTPLGQELCVLVHRRGEHCSSAG